MMNPLDATRRLPVWGWVVLGVAAFVLVGIGFSVEIRIVVVNPDLGDVSSLIGAIGTTLTTFAGLASFAVAIYNQLTQRPRQKDGPERRFRFAGENNEFNLYFGENQAEEPYQRDHQAADEESGETEVDSGRAEESQEST